MCNFVSLGLIYGNRRLSYCNNLFFCFFTEDLEIPEKENVFLNILGENPNNTKNMGEDVHQEVAIRWQTFATKGVNKDTIEDLIKKYPPPENCKLIQPPKLNNEVDVCLSREARKQDQFLVQLQNKMTTALSSMGRLMTDIIKEEKIDPQKVLSTLAENGQILCDNLYQTSMHRRFLIKPFLREEKRKVVCECSIDEYLFGGKLQESIQSEKSVAQAGRELKLNLRSKKYWNKNSFPSHEPQPGPSGLQMQQTKPRPSFLNYRRPTNHPKKKARPADYVNYPRRPQHQQRGPYVSRR